jgi:hypothetical protein
MNNTTIIIGIHFAVILFQHSPLTRRVFYDNIRQERGYHHQQQQVGERKTSSISSWSADWRIYKSLEVFFSSSTQQRGWSIINTTWRWSSIIILIGMRLR